MKFLDQGRMCKLRTVRQVESCPLLHKPDVKVVTLNFLDRRERRANLSLDNTTLMYRSLAFAQHKRLTSTVMVSSSGSSLSGLCWLLSRSTYILIWRKCATFGSSTNSCRSKRRTPCWEMTWLPLTENFKGTQRQKVMSKFTSCSGRYRTFHSSTLVFFSRSLPDDFPSNQPVERGGTSDSHVLLAWNDLIQNDSQKVKNMNTQLCMFCTLKLLQRTKSRTSVTTHNCSYDDTEFQNCDFTDFHPFFSD